MGGLLKEPIDFNKEVVSKSDPMTDLNTIDETPLCNLSYISDIVLGVLNFLHNQSTGRIRVWVLPEVETNRVSSDF